MVPAKSRRTWGGRAASIVMSGRVRCSQLPPFKGAKAGRRRQRYPGRRRSRRAADAFIVSRELLGKRDGSQLPLFKGRTRSRLRALRCARLRLGTIYETEVVVLIAGGGETGLRQHADKPLRSAGREGVAHRARLSRTRRRPEYHPVRRRPPARRSAPQCDPQSSWPARGAGRSSSPQCNPASRRWIRRDSQGAWSAAREEHLAVELSACAKPKVERVTQAFEIDAGTAVDRRNRDIGLAGHQPRGPW